MRSLACTPFRVDAHPASVERFRTVTGHVLLEDRALGLEGFEGLDGFQPRLFRRLQCGLRLGARPSQFRGAAGIALTKPFDGNAASVGNGVMVALQAKDEAQVHRLYEIALANGGTDEGAPGDRGGGFFAGYFRDPEGNKLNAFVMSTPA